MQRRFGNVFIWGSFAQLKSRSYEWQYSRVQELLTRGPSRIPGRPVNLDGEKEHLYFTHP